MSLKWFLIFSCTLLAASAIDAYVGRIVGGQDAVDGQFPFQVSLRRNGSHSCGGSIIANRFILTAGHCVLEAFITPYPASMFTVQAGSTDRLSESVVIKVKAIALNPYYEKYRNDLAVLELEEPLIYSDNVQPIELATEQIPVGAVVTVSGWGRIRAGGEVPIQLKYNTLMAMSKNKCFLQTGMLMDGLLCLGHDLDNGVCNGDSGGPAVFGGKLVGAAAFVVSSCGSTYPDGFSRISYYADWINSIVS